MKKLLCTLTVVLVVFFLAITDVFSGPTIIRDNRVTDLATTPVLGRGYSIGTNTFQSTCLKKVTLTEPSYDMQIYFESIEAEGAEQRKKTSSYNESTSSSYKSSRSWSFFGFGSSSTYSRKNTLDRSSESVVIEGVKYYNHDIFVNIDLYSYYASVDESKSSLSDAAVKLLESKDLPGFFSSCGPYYVRSIGRKARFISKFTYRSTEKTRNTSFESKLKSAVQSFSTESKKGWGSYRRKTETSYENEKEYKNSVKFNSEAKSRRLIITTAAFGLGKNERATLIAYDLDTFRESLGDAFKSMQNPRTGKVSSIEVVPWVENTEFQANVQLEEETIAPEEGAEGAKPRKLLLYEKKYILTLNAEFLMEVERADRNLMNMYYKARLCRKNIDMNWSNNGKLKGEYSARKIENHRTGDSMLLGDLDKALSEEFIQGLIESEQIFMYGTVPGKGKADQKPGGATACINDIMSKGIFKTSYRNHPSCEALKQKMGDVENDMINDYCMPVLAD